MSAFRNAAPWRAVAALSLGASLAACSGGSSPPRDASADPPDRGQSAFLSRQELMNPKTCEPCHPKHYREWASSMHAYAAIDPVFIAMNARGQRETQGQLGDFCVRCHAPMAVHEGATRDGLDLDELPQELKGVTCYFCHAAIDHDGLANNGLVLEEDGVMRGPLRRAVDPGVHGVAYSRHHDPSEPESSALCGSCHDVVTPAGVHMERTYAEWSESIFAHADDPLSFASCQTCHMEAASEEQPIAQMAGVELPLRKRHSHLWPAVDVALTDDFPDQDVQREAVLCELINSLGVAQLRAEDPLGLRFKVTLETAAGHAQPSGAAQDRRLWVEAIAYDAAGNVLFESGAIADDAVEELPPGSPGHDPHLVMLRDRIYDAAGHEVHMFWEAAPSTTYQTGYLSDLIAPPKILNVPHWIERTYNVGLPVARFEVRVRMRPVGMDILRSLVDSGDLDEAVLARMPTFTLGSASWTPKDRTSPLRLNRRDVRCSAGGF